MQQAAANYNEKQNSLSALRDPGRRATSGKLGTSAALVEELLGCWGGPGHLRGHVFAPARQRVATNLITGPLGGTFAPHRPREGALSRRLGDKFRAEYSLC